MIAQILIGILFTALGGYATWEGAKSYLKLNHWSPSVLLAGGPAVIFLGIAMIVSAR